MSSTYNENLSALQLALQQMLLDGLHARYGALSAAVQKAVADGAAQVGENIALSFWGGLVTSPKELEAAEASAVAAGYKAEAEDALLPTVAPPAYDCLVLTSRTGQAYAGAVFYPVVWGFERAQRRAIETIERLREIYAEDPTEENDYSESALWSALAEQGFLVPDGKVHCPTVWD